MTAHREIEMKWALSAEAYRALRQRLTQHIGPGQLLQQSNHFYDTTDLRLRRAQCNVRLRRENGRWQCTCKQKHERGPAGAHQHDEWEHWLAWERADAPQQLTARDIPLPPHFQELIGADALQYHGGFSNERWAFAYTQAPNGLLCLDKTTYSAERIDYELEIETTLPAESHSYWAEQLTRWQIEFTQQPSTKFARFVKMAAEKK
jgi:uncharacterized protein YjbK